MEALYVNRAEALCALLPSSTFLTPIVSLYHLVFFILHFLLMSAYSLYETLIVALSHELSAVDIRDHPKCTGSGQTLQQSE